MSIKRGDIVLTSEGRRVKIVFVEEGVTRPWAFYKWSGGRGSPVITVTPLPFRPFV